MEVKEAHELKKKEVQKEICQVEVASAEAQKVAPGKHLVTSNFQVADVRKPLLSVKRIVQRGNLVQFGDRPGESFIYKKESQLHLQ